MHYSVRRCANLIKRSPNTLHNTRHKTRLMSASETDLYRCSKPKGEGRLNVVNAQRMSERALYGARRAEREARGATQLVQLVNYWSRRPPFGQRVARRERGRGGAGRGGAGRACLPRPLAARLSDVTPILNFQPPSLASFLVFVQCNDRCSAAHLVMDCHFTVV